MLTTLTRFLHYVMALDHFSLIYGVEDDALRPRGGPITESCDDGS
jgi:hypothetical protein